MTITIGWWIIPLIISIVCGVRMVLDSRETGDYDFGSVFALLWLIPAMGAWLFYFVFFWIIS